MNPEDRTTMHRRADGSPFVVRTMSDLPPRRECPGDGCDGCEWCRIDATDGPDEVES